MDVSDFKMALTDLKSLNCGTLQESGTLPTRYATDLRLVDAQFNSAFSNCGIRPNELQFAIAQFAIAYSVKHRR
jgi:hypothetical protein